MSRLSGLAVFNGKRPRVLVLWPHPRSHRIWASICDPRSHEEADAFTYLSENGFGFATLDGSGAVLNPLAARGSALAGIDFVRFGRLLLNYTRFDAVVSMDSSSGLLFAFMKRVFRVRKPLIVIDPALTTNYPLRQKIHDLVLPAADAVIVFGTVQEDYLRERYGDSARVRFIRHRIDLRFFDSAKESWPEPTEPYLLSVGDDIGRDYRTLLRAIDGLAMKVLIKSSRPIPEPLPANAQVISNRISFEALKVLYRNARLVALPLHSTLHASGINTLLEAMAMTKAVVVSGSSGIADYVRHKETGWLVAPESEADLRCGIVSLWENAVERERLGRNARRFCETYCSMPFYMRQVSTVIRGCMPGIPERAHK